MDTGRVRCLRMRSEPPVVKRLPRPSDKIGPAHQPAPIDRLFGRSPFFIHGHSHRSRAGFLAGWVGLGRGGHRPLRWPRRHRRHPSRPGFSDVGRSIITMEDHVQAIVDAVREYEVPVVLVLHSGAGTPGYGATDRSRTGSPLPYASTPVPVPGRGIPASPVTSTAGGSGTVSKSSPGEPRKCCARPAHPAI
jgi:hypothetical protein